MNTGPLRAAADNFAKKAGSWPGVALAIIVALLSYASNSGANKQRMDEMERRITLLEQNSVGHQEMQDLKDAVRRIEDKLDQDLQRGH